MSTTSANLSIAGLASGFDWQTMVSQLIAVESEPVTQLQTQDSTLQSKNSAYTQIGTDLTNLNTSIQALLDPSLFNARQASLSDATVATATADDTAPLGNYTFSFGQLATSAAQLGAANTALGLNATSDVSGLTLANAAFVSPITAGTFTVNGQAITVATTDTLQSVFAQINKATGGIVSGSYDPKTDTISLTSSDKSQIVLGSTTDTSNFLQAAKLYKTRYRKRYQHLGARGRATQCHSLDRKFEAPGQQRNERHRVTHDQWRDDQLRRRE